MAVLWHRPGMKHILRQFCSLGVLLLSIGCTLTKVSPEETLAIAEQNNLAEEALLDIGITVFVPLVEEVDPEIGSVIDGLRFAESRYLSWQMAVTLQESGHWGRVTLQPGDLTRADLMVSGTILQSDGQTLRIVIEVRDASERVWFNRQYVQIINSEDNKEIGTVPPFPFAAIFNRIANDMLAWRKRRYDEAAMARLRQFTDMQFARELAPEVYGQYLQSGNDALVLTRLPSADDPIYSRIADMRQRNDVLIDTLQDRYDLFVRGIEQPYLLFLDRSLRITELINAWLLRLSRDSEYSDFLDKDFTESFETRFGMGRSPLYNSRSNSLNSGWRTEYYAMALAEAGFSLDELVRPESEIFNERIVSLTNGAGIQYSQWKIILDELYELESGVVREP